MGISSERMSMPKNVLIRLIIAQAAKTITKPISAAVIWFLAPSVAALSPPDVMYLIPPRISMKRKTSAAIIRIKIITAEMMLVIVISPRVENCPLPPAGVRSIWVSKEVIMLKLLCNVL